VAMPCIAGRDRSPSVGELSIRKAGKFWGRGGGFEEGVHWGNGGKNH
jgi:hypothetical protein